nr:uncharacterized protein CI109_007528 [Kwoniella shandongensis]KAA5524177.1 hypothetical protein CI109_007528 [Kwoniella shandongensis]
MALYPAGSTSHTDALPEADMVDSSLDRSGSVLPYLQARTILPAPSSTSSTMAPDYSGGMGAAYDYTNPTTYSSPGQYAPHVGFPPGGFQPPEGHGSSHSDNEQLPYAAGEAVPQVQQTPSGASVPSGTQPFNYNGWYYKG